jgi:ArsR family transcriptional regulator
MKICPSINPRQEEHPLHELEKPFKALSDSNRLRILNLLSEKSLCVCEIAAVLGLAVSTASKHLSILRDAGFITDQKDAKWVNYSLAVQSGSSLAGHLAVLVRRRFSADPIFAADRIKIKTVDRNRLCGS